METATKPNSDKDDTVISDKENLIVNDIIKNIANKEGYQNYNVDTKFHSMAEQGFLGTTCEVNIKDTTGKNVRETNIFVKIMNPNISTFLAVPEIYAKELFVYKNLSEIYEDLQNEFNVPESEKYKMVKSYSDFPPTVIVLENMNKRGYSTLHRSKTVSMEYAVLAVKELAKFHALSLALKEKRSKYFEQNIATLKHSLTFNEDWSNYTDHFLEITMEYVNDEVKRKLEIFKMVFNEKYKMYMDDDKFNICLCHGDFKPSNILIKETNGKVSEVIPIDYQLVYYGCPVMDLIYFMFASLDQNMRRNIPYLKDIYYGTMESFLSYFDIKVQDVLRREHFEVMYKERLDYGLLVSILMMPIIMAPDENIENLDTMASTAHNPGKDCQEKMIGIINDFIDWGYL